MDPKVMKITPDMIGFNDSSLHTFDTYEAELAAKSIIIFCQLVDGWAPFTKEQIRRVFNQFTSPVAIEFEACFECLLEGDYIYQVGDYFMVTNEFVRRCFKKHPARSSFLA